MSSKQPRGITVVRRCANPDDPEALKRQVEALRVALEWALSMKKPAMPAAGEQGL